MNNKHVVVIGAVNTDIWGRPRGGFTLRDSNPGSVSLRPGGVGRNIAHDLRLLGLEVSLIAPLGDDVYAAGIQESCRSIGIDLSMAPVFPGERSSTYMYMTDINGDMLVGVSDMDITEHMTPEKLAPYMDRINQSAALVIDSNYAAGTIAWLCDNCKVPIYADPVSAAKAPKLKGALGQLRAIKPNAMEAEALTGEAAPESAAKVLIEAGVQRVFISCGANGIIAAEGDRLVHVTGRPARMVNATGAGDAATAAIVWADMQGLELEDTARLAVLAGTVTTECEQTNNPNLKQLILFGE